jgi:hypothetical protein
MSGYECESSLFATDFGDRFADWGGCPSRKCHPDFGCQHPDKGDFRFMGQLLADNGSFGSRGISATTDGRNPETQFKKVQNLSVGSA